MVTGAFWLLRRSAFSPETIVLADTPLAGLLMFISTSGENLDVTWEICAGKGMTCIRMASVSQP